MKKIRWVFLLFTSIGVILLVAGFFTVRSTRKFLARAETAAGIVVENIWRDDNSSHSRSNSGVYYPRVRFTTRAGEDMEFISNTGSMPASYQPNEGVNVVYDPEDPHHAQIKGFSSWVASIILLALGTVFSLVGIGPLVWMRSRERMKNWLRANGQCIQTTFERVELDRSVTVNGSHPYRIVSQWLNPATNQVHVFKSDSIWFDPSRYVSGDQVAVWIDPANPKRYSMETGFLPQSAD